MTSQTLSLALLLTCCTTMPIQAESFRVYFGTYSQPKDGGIFTATFDAATGKLSPATLAAPTVNPSFVAIHPNHKFLYAVGEIADFQGQKTGGVSAYAIDAKTGKLMLLNQQSSAGTGPCHIVLDKTGGTALVANYGGGSVASLAIGADGKLTPAVSAIQHKGSSVNSSRQEAPHAHSINLDAANEFAFAADLGLDKILVYKFDPAAHTLTPNSPDGVEVAPGAGPRHFAFHPSGQFAYVINELSNTVTAFKYDDHAGVLTEIQTITTLPEDYKETSYTSEVVVHPSGKFLYGSNRGHDSLAVFAIDPSTGKLTSTGFVKMAGKTPRNFSIDPTGRWILAGNQGSNTVSVFSIDPETGMLTQQGESIDVPAPVCVRFLPLK
ncbi:beta-propeller fold lactonase family protein [bacterium]|nr:beta-propeller fold lactonase family protein [bacterium]